MFLKNRRDRPRASYSLIISQRHITDHSAETYWFKGFTVAEVFVLSLFHNKHKMPIVIGIEDHSTRMLRELLSIQLTTHGQKCLRRADIVAAPFLPTSLQLYNPVYFHHLPEFAEWQVNYQSTAGPLAFQKFSSKPLYFVNKSIGPTA